MIQSAFLFKNRPGVKMLEDGKVELDINPEHYAVPETELQETEFVFHRLYDFSEALKIAEEQIQTLLEEMPFIPEEFGFEVIHRPETISDSPVRVYASKYDPRFTLFREVMDVNSMETFRPENWVLMKNENDEFQEIKVKLPCHRIAYAVFYSLGVKVELEQHEADKAPVAELPPVKETNLFDVTFTRDTAYAFIEKISAVDESDARTKALFLFQTDDFYTNVPKDIQFEELTVTYSETHEKSEDTSIASTSEF
jgi:hypothetical protein